MLAPRCSFSMSITKGLWTFGLGYFIQDLYVQRGPLVCIMLCSVPIFVAVGVTAVLVSCRGSSNPQRPLLTNLDGSPRSSSLASRSAVSPSTRRFSIRISGLDLGAGWRLWRGEDYWVLGDIRFVFCV